MRGGRGRDCSEGVGGGGTVVRGRDCSEGWDCSEGGTVVRVGL